MSTNVKEYRIGRFLISGALVYESPDSVQPIMAQCVVVRATRDADITPFERDAVVYTALSPLFRPIKLGQLIPWYAWRCTDGSWTVDELPEAP